mmetsp:Transcript_864/g.2792  ORF Transcript_864/g.2792 Transcript_864/m.2792 type:complete len:222 (+) Transcript_864:1860-2525(+)
MLGFTVQGAFPDRTPRRKDSANKAHHWREDRLRRVGRPRLQGWALHYTGLELEQCGLGKRSRRGAPVDGLCDPVVRGLEDCHVQEATHHLFEALTPRHCRREPRVEVERFGLCGKTSTAATAAAKDAAGRSTDRWSVGERAHHRLGGSWQGRPCCTVRRGSGAPMQGGIQVLVRCCRRHADTTVKRRVQVICRPILQEVPLGIQAKVDEVVVQSHGVFPYE